MVKQEKKSLPVSWTQSFLWVPSSLGYSAILHLRICIKSSTYIGRIVAAQLCAHNSIPEYHCYKRFQQAKWLKKIIWRCSNLFRKDLSGQMRSRYGTVSNRHYLFLADGVSEAYDFKCLWINILADKAQDRVWASVSATHYWNHIR